MNNLKQIGIATHQYHDQHKHFPQGTVPGEFSPEKRLSWHYRILPFLEQPDLHKSIDQSKAWDAEQNRLAVFASINNFLCPGRTDWAEMPMHFTNYLGVAGVGTDAALLPTIHPRAGLFGYDRVITLDDIKDGTSRTLVSVETLTNLGPWSQGGPSTVRGLSQDESVYIGESRSYGTKHRTDSVFRTHANVANTLFADVSVFVLTDRINPEVFRALATIAGGEKNHNFDD